MSNKSLLILLIVILVLFGAAAIFYSRRQQGSTLNGQSNPNLEQQATNQQADAVAQADQAAECQRDFDQSKLSQNVDIKNRQVEIDVTNFGKIVFELYDQDAPKAVENFLKLANSGYYDCLTFHRVAQEFVIQGGDPSGNGSGGQSAFGQPFADELNPNAESYKAGYLKGVLAMANSGPNTNGSQFFIMLEDKALSHDYTIFGKVIAGQEIVDRIGQVPITPALGPTDGSPKTPVIMQKVSIIK